MARSQKNKIVIKCDMKSIELTSTERLWYEKLCAAGIDSNAANMLARWESTRDIFKDLYPNMKI